jgi:hypothetical protein
VIENWLLQPTITKTEVKETPLDHTQGGDPAECVSIVVPGRGFFLVMRPTKGSFSKEFVDNICQYLYGAVYEWYEVLQ